MDINGIIAAHLIESAERPTIADSMFGAHFPLIIEPTIYYFADMLCPNYHGGYWHFFTLTNGGFYMAPDCSEPMPITAPNGYRGRMSADAMGMACCLYTYSNLAFAEDQRLSQLCSNHYYWLREYAMEHKEVRLILAAID